MVQVAKTLVFLCVLIGLQAFPQSDVISENDAVEDADERRDVNVPDVTPPVCRLVNKTDCPLSCGSVYFRVVYIMSDGNGSKIIPSFSEYYTNNCNSTSVITFNSAVDENGYNATSVDYTGSCCLKDVEVFAVDEAGNKAKCPFDIKCTEKVTTTTTSPVTVKPTSSSSITTISFWSSLMLTTLKSILI